MTNRYIASYCGISTSTVSKYINAKGSESIKTRGGQKVISEDTEDLLLIECYIKIMDDQHITKNDVIEIVGVIYYSVSIRLTDIL